MAEKLIKRLIATEADRQAVIRELQVMPLDKVKYVTFGDATRTLIQNARFHAFCTDVSNKKEWAGSMQDVPTWKCLFVSAHARAKGQISDPTLGLENELVCIRESTADMGVKRMASLLEYQQYWCADNNIRITAPKWMYEEAK